MKSDSLKKMKCVAKQMVICFALFLFAFFITKVSANAAGSEEFWVEYIDVGQGDCSLIQCDGHYMLIDGGPSDASSIVYSVLKNKGIKNIDLMIATHPDADHIGGLSGALNYAKVDTVLSPVKTHDTKTFKSFEKYVSKQGKTFSMPIYGDLYELGSAKVEILGPIYDNAESNNLSIVVKVTYGNNSFLFMGDAEEEEEDDILRRNKQLLCDVLKVGHHGSNSSTSDQLLKTVNPKYAVLSVGENTYGHPTQETIDKLVKANVEIYRTDLQGDIVISSDGNEITVSTERNASEKDIKSGGSNKTRTASTGGNEVTIPSNTTFVLNTNSKKFHYPSCDSVNKMSAKNMQFSTDTATAILAMGYVPCKACNPYNDEISKTTEKTTEQIVEQKTQAEESVSSRTTYVLNKNTKKFHYSNCASVRKMSEKNRQDVTGSRDEIIAQGYVPCKNCNP